MLRYLLHAKELSQFKQGIVVIDEMMRVGRLISFEDCELRQKRFRTVATDIECLSAAGPFSLSMCNQVSALGAGSDLMFLQSSDLHVTSSFYF